MADKKSHDHKKFLAEWLEKLQQESWQLELLISGFALYGIFEGRHVIANLDLYYFFNVQDQILINILSPVRKILQIGWAIFFINLLLHVILRGLWIGAIGLRYISGDIDYEELNYSEVFTNFLKKKIGTYDDFIERLEKICSVLFAYTFLMFLLFLSLMVFLTFIPVVTSFFITDSPSFVIILFLGLYFFLGFLVFIDFITLGGFKRIKDRHVSKGYYYVYRFYSFITLSFLYRGLLYNFIDDKYTRRLFYFSIPFILVLLIGQFMFSNNAYPYFESQRNLLKYGETINDGYYDDLRDKKIQSLSEFEQKRAKLDLPNVIMDKFYADNNHSSIFFRMLLSDSHLFKDSTTQVSPIHKEGFIFSLFSSTRYENEEVEKIEEESEETIKSTWKTIRDLKKKQRKEKDKESIIQMEIDSLEKNIRKVQDAVDEKIKVYSERNAEKIKNTMLSWIDISIDEIPYKDSLNCYYYIHKNYDNKGLMCIFNNSNLDIGMHELHVKRKRYNKLNGTRTEEYKLPFVITKQNN